MSQRKLRIVFMGTPEFAVASLDALFHSRHEIAAVVTVADKPAGRGRQLQESPVKQYAVSKGIPVLQPLKLRDEEFVSALRLLQADLFVVVAFRMLPEIVWSMPPMGTINLHGSLLPKYRGAAPINRAVMNGETETGVTTFFLQHEIDTGKVIRRETLPIGPDEDAGSVHDRMMAMGAIVLKETVDSIADNTASAIPQNDLIADPATLPHAPKIFPEDCIINWNQNGASIHHFVRGLSPYPAARTSLNGTGLKIFSGKFEASSSSESNATVNSDQKTFLRFKCNDGWYYVHQLQLDGKKRMGVEEFLRGYRL